jgi:hypothetical protein
MDSRVPDALPDITFDREITNGEFAAVWELVSLRTTSLIDEAIPAYERMDVAAPGGG